MKPTRTLLRRSVLFVWFLVASGQTWAEEYLSNLGDLWPGWTYSIGDVETLVYPYDPFVVQFSTGSGTNEAKLSETLSGADRQFPQFIPMPWTRDGDYLDLVRSLTGDARGLD